MSQGHLYLTTFISTGITATLVLLTLWAYCSVWDEIEYGEARK